MPSLTRITIGTRIAALSEQAGEKEAKRRQALSILEEEQRKARDNHRDYMELMRRTETRAQTMLESVELIMKSQFNSMEVKKDTATKGLRAIQKLHRDLVEYGPAISRLSGGMARLRDALQGAAGSAGGRERL